MTKENIIFKAKGSEIIRFCDMADVVEQDILISMCKDGMSFSAVDPSHVALIEVKIGRITGKHQQTQFGIQVKDLRESAEKSEDITISWSKDGKHIDIKADKWVTNVRPLDGGTITPPAMPDKVNPPHTKTVHCSIPDFKLGCDRLAKISDLVELTLDRTLTGKTSSGGSSRVFSFSNKQEKRSYPTNMKKVTSSTYSLTYLGALAKKLKPKDSVTKKVNLPVTFTLQKDDYPLAIRGVEGRMSWTYFLAPRIENN